MPNGFGSGLYIANHSNELEHSPWLGSGEEGIGSDSEGDIPTERGEFVNGSIEEGCQIRVVSKRVVVSRAVGQLMFVQRSVPALSGVLKQNN